MTGAAQWTRGGMSIGSVLDLLRPDFPDITISKIRFLESEGLIRPERTPRDIADSRSPMSSG